MSRRCCRRDLTGISGHLAAAGAGIICPWSAQVADPAWRVLAYAAAREYPALTARLADLGETDVGYRQVGALALAERDPPTCGPFGRHG